MIKIILALVLLLATATVFASSPHDCIQKADGARAEMLRYKEGQSTEAAVKQSTVDAARCIADVDAHGKTQIKDEAIASWKAFQKLREEKILPTVVFYNQQTKDNKANLDMTKDALKSMGEDNKSGECIRKADEARAALLLYKDGKGDEAVVNKTAEDTSVCIEKLDIKGKELGRATAIKAWKTFRSIREGKIIPAVKSFMKNSSDNTANLTKTKDALKLLE
ncbi:MAG: hypothetical protein H7301_04905 [Cryobacterium sp.]|nr:hypothetical protein [Oligoflexia bacterium]